MAIFGNPPATQKSDSSTPNPPPSTTRMEEKRPEPTSPKPMSSATPATTPTPRPSAATSEGKESVIASDLTIEGKIEGSGHVRLAGKFKGDVNVQGDLTIEVGAKLNGGVKARKVIIAGELEGNVDSAERVELLDSGTLVGDIKAGTVNIAAGAKMRGQVEFGWGKDGGKSGSSTNGKGSAGENGTGS